MVSLWNAFSYFRCLVISQLSRHALRVDTSQNIMTTPTLMLLAALTGRFCPPRYVLLVVTCMGAGGESLLPKILRYILISEPSRLPRPILPCCPVDNRGGARRPSACQCYCPLGIDVRCPSYLPCICLLLARVVLKPSLRQRFLHVPPTVL